MNSALLETMYKKHASFLITLFSTLLLSSCGGATPSGGGDSSPPAVPTGLSATGGNQTIALQWNANSEEDLAGYVLFWGTSAEQLDQQASLEKTQTSHTMNSLQNDLGHFFALVARDTSGNASEKSEMISVTPTVPDSTKPTVTLSSSNSSVTSAGGITLSADASDDVAVSKVEFFDGANKLGEAVTALYSLELFFTAADNGNHSYTAKAFDSSGNEATSNAVDVNVNIQASGDTTAPTVSISSSQSSVTSASSVKLSATASDNVGVVKVAFFEGSNKLGEDGSQPYEFNLNFDAGDNGSHTYTATAFDAAGNKSNADVTVSVTISTADTSAPNVSLSSSATTVSQDANYIILTANANDNVGVSKVEFYHNDALMFTSAAAPYKKTVGLTVYNNGANSFKAIAYDTSGNTKTSNSVTVNVNITFLRVNALTGVMKPTSPDQVFKTLSEAAKVAPSGATVYLGGATYSAATGEVFPITFPAGVTVSSADNTVVIEGSGNSNGLIFTNGGKLEGIVVQNFANFAAVRVQGGEVNILQSRLAGSKFGLEIVAGNVSATKLTINNNGTGIYSKDATLTMTSSVIEGNDTGILLTSGGGSLTSTSIRQSLTAVMVSGQAELYINSGVLDDNNTGLHLTGSGGVSASNTTIKNGQRGVITREASNLIMTGGEISGMAPNCNQNTYGVSAGGKGLELSGVTVKDNLGYALSIGFSTKAKVVNSTFLTNGATGNCSVPYANTVVSSIASGELTLENTTIKLPNPGTNTHIVWNQAKMTFTGGSVGGAAKVCLYSDETLTIQGTTVIACEKGIQVQNGTADFDNITVQNHTTSGIEFVQGSLRLFNSSVFSNGGAGVVVKDEGASLGQLAICCGGTTIPGNNHIHSNTFFGVNTVTDEPGENFIVVANGNTWNANKQGANAAGKYASAAVIDGPISGVVGDNYNLVANTKIIR
jgi:hypothetical protein